jgi:hypothetical protein
MLMFFVCTQREHTWKSPKYWFNWRQRETWDVLIEQAERVVEREKKTEEVEKDKKIEDMDRETIDEVEEEIEAREGEQNLLEQPLEQAKPVKSTLLRI